MKAEESSESAPKSWKIKQEKDAPINGIKFDETLTGLIETQETGVKGTESGPEGRKIKEYIDDPVTGINGTVSKTKNMSIH